MYICICNAITDSDIRTLVSAGARSVAQVYRRLGCKPQCCKCVEDVKRLLNGADPLSLPGAPHG